MIKGLYNDIQQLNYREYKMIQDRIFKAMQLIVNSAAYPYLLGAGFACFLAYIIVEGL